VAKYLKGFLIGEFVSSLGSLHDAVGAMEPEQAQLLVVQFHQLLDATCSKVFEIYLCRDLGQLRRRIWESQRFHPATHPLLLWYNRELDFTDFCGPLQKKRRHASLDNELFDFYKILRDSQHHRFRRWEADRLPLETFASRRGAAGTDGLVFAPAPSELDEPLCQSHPYHALFALLKGAQIAAGAGRAQVAFLLLWNILSRPAYFGSNPVRAEMWCLLAGVTSQLHLSFELSLACCARAVAEAVLPSQRWMALLARQAATGDYGFAKEEERCFKTLVATLPQSSRLYRVTWLLHIACVLRHTQDLLLCLYACPERTGRQLRSVESKLEQLRVLAKRVGRASSAGWVPRSFRLELGDRQRDIAIHRAMLWNFLPGHGADFRDSLCLAFSLGAWSPPDYVNLALHMAKNARRTTLQHWLSYEQMLSNLTVQGTRASQQEFPLFRCERMFEVLCYRCCLSPFRLTNAELVSQVLDAYRKATSGRHRRVSLLRGFYEQLANAVPFSWPPATADFAEPAPGPAGDASFVESWLRRESSLLGGTLHRGLDMLQAYPYF